MTEAKSNSECPYAMRGLMVVITTEHIFNLEIFTPELLVKRGLIPPEWRHFQYTRNLTEVDLQYQNGTRWTLAPQRLNISESVFLFQQSYTCHDLAEKYLKEFSDGEYDQLGLNCLLSLSEGDPSSFLTRRFSPWLMSDEKVRILPDFVSEVGGGKGLIKCGSGDDWISGEARSCVVLDCNINFPGPLTVDEMVGHISQWKEKEQELISVVDRILGEPE